MNTLRHTLIKAAALSLGFFAVSSIASAQEACDPTKEKCPEPPKVGDCSPGFYKNHLDFWYQIYCDNGSYPTSCALLLQALTCKGANALCGRGAAAAYLNSVSGCLED